MNSSGKAEGRSNRKKRILIILSALLLVLVIGIVYLFVTQGNNLKAIYLALTSDPDSIAQIQQSQKEKQEEVLGQYGLTVPTEQDIAQPSPSLDPSVTPSPDPSATPSADPSAQPSTTPGQTQDGNAELQAQLQAQINKLYQAEASYYSVINGIVASAKQEFYALPKAQQTTSSKASIVQSKTGQLIAYENSCDAQVESILAEITSILDQMGKSHDLVNEIRSYYQNSKANWKAAKMTELYS